MFRNHAKLIEYSDDAAEATASRHCNKSVCRWISYIYSLQTTATGESADIEQTVCKDSAGYQDGSDSDLSIVVLTSEPPGFTSQNNDKNRIALAYRVR